MPEFDVAVWVLVCFYAAMVGLAKTGVPGIGLLGGVLLITLAEGWMVAKEAVGFMLPMLIAGDIFALSYYRRHAVWRHLARLLPWAVAGVLLGNQTMGVIGDRDLKHIIGALVVVLLAVDWWRNSRGESVRIPNQWWVAAVVGVSAGFATMLANAAGPLIALYLLALTLEKREFIGTAAWFFLIINTFKVPFFLHQKMITQESFTANLMLIPAIALGAICGIFLLKRLPQARFVIIVKVLTLCSAVKLLLS
jgi:hypothetical protein